MHQPLFGDFCLSPSPAPAHILAYHHLWIILKEEENSTLTA